MHTLDDALETVAVTEHIDDYIDPVTRLPVEATKRTVIEKLPLVLILQLKRFVYTSAGVEKVFKFVSYPPELEVPARAFPIRTGALVGSSSHSTRGQTSCQRRATPPGQDSGCRRLSTTTVRSRSAAITRATCYTPRMSGCGWTTRMSRPSVFEM